MFSTFRPALRRSYLYVPSTSDRMLQKSLVSESDVIVYDLEDSVPPSSVDKENARMRLSNFLLVCRWASFHIQCFTDILQQNPFSNVERNAVRINDVTSVFFQDDIRQIVVRALLRPVFLISF